MAMRHVGVDVGQKRVGIAISDPLAMFAQPVGTFSPSQATHELQRIDRMEGIDTLVVGWPLLPDGSEGEATRSVDRYIRSMRAAVPGAQLVRWDERWTSELAKEKIREAGKKRRWSNTKGRVDAAAAAIMLQEFLDDRRRTPDVESPGSDD